MLHVYGDEDARCGTLRKCLYVCTNEEDALCSLKCIAKQWYLIS